MAAAEHTRRSTEARVLPLWPKRCRLRKGRLSLLLQEGVALLAVANR